MAVLLIGLNHRSAPLELLERATIRADAVPKALHDLLSRGTIAEAVVLSTCNRTEVYAVADRFHAAYHDAREFFCDLIHIAPEDLADHLYSQHDEDAAAHLFEVAAGLDSAVLGESEILGQVRDAWQIAQAEGASRTTLNALFRHALGVGKRARTETAIGRATASVSQAAVAMTAERLGTLAGARVLVVGAGAMGEGMTMALAGAGVSDVRVANRTPERAEALAACVGGRAVAFDYDTVVDTLRDVDVLLTSTGAGDVIIERAVIESAMAGRHDRPLLVVDIAVPRDVDPGVADVPGVVLLDLDDLRAWADQGLAARRAEAESVRRIVADEVGRYAEVAAAREVAPLLAQLHDRGESVRQAELGRFRARLNALDDRQREAVEALTRGLVAKLLHEPSVRLKHDAGTARGERNASALRELFDLS